MRTDKKSPQKADKKTPSRAHNRGVVGYSKKSALLEEAITHMNTGKYGRSSAALKQLLALDPQNTEARRLFATLHLRLGSLVTARQAFESLAKEAIERQDFWLAESLLREYLAAGPRCIPFLELLAHVHEGKGDAVAAVTELGKAIDILIEDPDSDNPQKPSQLYTKVRELAPASSIACQLASFFDIQTGELLASRPSAPAAATSLEVDVSQPKEEISATAEGARTSDVMPWEQLDEAPPSHETLPAASSNSVIESLNIPDVVVDPAPVGLAPPGPEGPLSKSTGPIQEANHFDQETAPPKLAEPPSPLNEYRHDRMGDSIAEHSTSGEERLTPNSSGKDRVDDGNGITSSVNPLGLSSPMPWEQLEKSTVCVDEATPSTSPIVQSEGTPLLLGGESIPAPAPTAQPESVSDQLANRAPTPDLTEPSESIFAAEPSTSPAELPEPELPTPSAANLSSTVPLSGNTNLDGAWRMAAGTLSSSSPAPLFKPYTSLQDARELEPVYPESELSTPSIPSTPELLVLFSDPESSSSANPSIVNGSIERTDTIQEPELLSPTPILLSEEPSQVEEPAIFSSEIPSSFKTDPPAQSLPDPVEPACDSEPITTEQHEIPNSLSLNAAAPPLSQAQNNAPSAAPDSIDIMAQWSTGEVEVQLHRQLEKKRQWDKEKEEAPAGQPAPLPLVERSPEPVVELSRTGGWESAPSDPVAPVVHVMAPILEQIAPQEDTRPEWIRESESITFMNPPPPSSAMWQDSSIESSPSKPEPEISAAASAVDILFDSTESRNRLHKQDPVATRRPRPRLATRMARIRIGISSFLGTCFTTTRSIVLLCVGLAVSSVALVAIGIGAIGLTWMMMETSPSPAYHNLTVAPPQALTDSRKNGYFLLLGFDVPAEQNPLQAGYERTAEWSDLQAASACMIGDEGNGMTTTGASHSDIHGWFTSADPAAQIALQTTAVQSWVAQESLALKRYRQWLPMPFEDVGYGQILSPNCNRILLAHRLYLAEGFAQGLNTGLERLETDMGSWRVVLEQSKTLMVKMLAATAVQDNIAIASGLLIRQGLDGEVVGRLGKIVRPLDPIELSLRWPMQSHLAWASKAVTASLKNKKDERPLYVDLAAAMPLPVQRRSNAYADYYEAASKAVAEGRYTNLPKLSSFIRTPAGSTLDYLTNPIEHIIGIEPLPSWDPYVGRMVETDARLRLASLQVWIRRGAQEESVLTRLAKAGQALYDPFTGLPMLLNQQRGVMYSVGQDGKDQEGDSLHDVVVTIPKLNRS